MTTNDRKTSKTELSGLTDSIPFLLAGIEDGLNEFSITGITLQRLPDGDFRCILRGYYPPEDGDPVHLIAFTNAGLAAECLHLAESSFAEGLTRWHIDQYAKGNNFNGSGQNKKGKLTRKR